MTKSKKVYLGKLTRTKQTCLWDLLPEHIQVYIYHINLKLEILTHHRWGLGHYIYDPRDGGNPPGWMQSEQMRDLRLRGLFEFTPMSDSSDEDEFEPIKIMKPVRKPAPQRVARKLKKTKAPKRTVAGKRAENALVPDFNPKKGDMKRFIEQQRAHWL